MNLSISWIEADIIHIYHIISAIMPELIKI